MESIDYGMVAVNCVAYLRENEEAGGIETENFDIAYSMLDFDLAMSELDTEIAEASE